MKNKNKLLIQLILLELLKFSLQQSCVNIWNADLDDFNTNLCPVSTDIGEFCSFPFTYNSNSYRSCVINLPGNSEKNPQCVTQSGKIANCIVPTDAVVTQVTTRKSGTPSINGVSLNGGTMLWISGRRFAINSFSVTPSAETSNEVFLTSNTASYPCEIHTDKVTATQITCYAPALPAASYLVRVKVRGELVPLYQYENINNADIIASNSNTPRINSISPMSGVPGTLITIEGDFKTSCYTRDLDECSDDSGSRITRVYFGGQICDLIDPATNDFYEPLTQRQMKCKLSGYEVNVFNGSILVSEQFGRSLTSRDAYLISPNEKFYNFRSFAEITSVTPSIGSDLGGTYLSINGSFFFHEESFPAVIEVGGTSCQVVSFDGNDKLNSKLVCITSSKPNIQDDQIGGRGISLIKENIFTSNADLDAAVPTSNAIISVLDKASYTDTSNSDVTVWLKGYFVPSKSSNYKFDLNSNSHAVLFISDNQTSQAKSRLINYDLTDGSNINVKYLEGGKKYYIEAISSKQGGKVTLSINAIMMDTFLTDSVSNLVSNEIHEIDISSDVTPEEVEITYDPEFSTEGTSEIQEIVVNSSSSTPFLLSFDGVVTSVIDFDASPLLIESALNDLPTLGDNYVNVTEIDSQDPNVRILRVIFSPSLGDVPLIEQGATYDSIEVNEIQKGDSNGRHIQLMIENAPTPFFDVQDSQQKIFDAFDKFFGIRCPASIIRTSNDVHSSFDFENECADDTRAVNETAFCGRCAKRTSTLVQNPNSLMTYRYICFAYLTSTSFGRISIQIESNFENLYSSAYVTSIADSKWHYTCVDLHVPGFSSISMTRAILKRVSISSAGNVLIDAVTIRRNVPYGFEDPSLLIKRRLFPSLQIYSSTLKVEKIGNNTISVSYRANNCSFNLEPILIRQQLNPSVASISKISDASPPVTGDFSLTWNGLNLNNIAADAPEGLLKNYLESLRDLGSVSVQRSKDCAGYKWRIKWTNGGDKPDLGLASSNLAGTNVAVNVNKVQDGGARFYPLLDDILRTHHSKPQVSVSINQITSRCVSDCSFEWSNSVTPQVNSINKDNPSSIVIRGSDFDPVASNNIVLIGQAACIVTSATESELTCEPENGPVGIYTFSVNVLGKGLARMNTNEDFEFQLSATDFNPRYSGVGGGITISITGSGFTSRTQVTIDSRPCKLVSNTYNTLSCIVPSNPTASQDVDVDVVVSESGQSETLATKFSYQFSNTPKVTNISPQVLSVLGNENITITGTNLPVPLYTIRIGTNRVKVLSSSPTEIRILSPSLNPGFYDLIISAGSLGNVMILNSIQLEYRLYISSIKPNIGSIRGGTLITIKGDGFSSDCSKNKVSFSIFECDVKSCDSNEIKCLTRNAQTNHQITNDGYHNEFGFRYEWDRSYLTVNKSDWVTWTWQPPTTVPGLKFKVEQVQGANSIEPNGFSSGEAVEYGSFKYQFHTPGIYYYWSGFVDINQRILFRGVIEVLDEQNLNKEFEIDLKLNEISAQKCKFPFNYNDNEQNVCVNENGISWCSPTSEFNGQKLECIDNSATDSCSPTLDDVSCGGANVAKNSVKFTDCDVPSISSVSPLRVNFESIITIGGSGFSANQCENEVYIGGKLCVIQSSTTSLITCKIDSNSTLVPNRFYEIEVMKKNVGFALHNTFYEIYFQSVIKTITPRIGSTTGGTKVTITGDGFTPDTYVVIGQNVYTRNTATIDYNSIVLITQADQGLQNISVFSHNKPAVCDSTCNFEFNNANTPVIESVLPTSVNQNTDLTISGQNFVDTQSLIKVTIGSQNCQVTSSSSTEIVCSIDGLDAGAQDININVETFGNSANSAVQVTGVAAINSISPTTGSIHGGTKVTILGNGFNIQSVVDIGGSLCSIESVKINEIICITSSHTAQDSISLNIETNGIVHSNDNNAVFSYQTEQTPVISSVSPTTVTSANTQITISGTGFSSDSNQVHVTIGASECSNVIATDTEIKCDLGANGAGSYPIVLLIDSKGLAEKSTSITYELVMSSLSSSQSGVAGGLELTIDGFGFSNNTLVSICDNSCSILSWTSTQLKCIVPKSDDTSGDSTCQLIAAENSLQQTLSFNYVKSITPTLTSVSPLRGGTGGGTVLTIEGLNFPNSDEVKVIISGSECLISSINSTQIKCYTGSYSRSSVKALIEVIVDGVGQALNNDVFFEYIDLWSSRFTWGGDEPPGEGELVVIGESQTVYFDTETPILKGIIIIGGALIFDDSQDVHLRAEYIIIAGNGRLQIGSEQSPFAHKATITMFGSVKSLELPIFGSKVIALREGTIEMYGKPVGVTWTQLGTTASAGSSQITLKEPVVWQVSSQIVIASTGNHLSQGQNEARTITAVSDDKRTLTLDRPLDFSHLAEVRNVPNGIQLEIRAEVGLLTRNVVVQGNNDESWTAWKSAKACPDGFNPGEFAVQTCFLGRYGDEIGTNEFGATLMVHADPIKQKFKETVFVKLSNVEFFHVGQAFRLGRYPIHFHLNYEMPSSFVKECTIHQSFNRAVNIHGTNYVTVERNFIYNILGGAYFLEDGIEIGNVFKYNLAIFVKTSSSLLNEDVTPAAFWVTNPNNTYLHNTVAGGTHFGWWYRILDRPDGPSFMPDYCPKKIPLGKFFNNTVHGVGRFGLWIFPGYTPTVTGGCNDRNPSLAKFEHLTAYNSDKGAEWVMSNSLQFRNFVSFDHESVGIETKTIVSHEDQHSHLSGTFFDEQTGSSVINSVIVGNSDSSQTTSKTKSGLVIAWERGLLIKNVSFYNFADESSHAIRATEITGRCAFGCGGWTTKFSGLTFNNVKYRTIHRWNWDFVGQDLDGSLTGVTNGYVVSTTNITLSNSQCAQKDFLLSGSVCSSSDWIRFAFNNVINLNYQSRINVTNVKNAASSIEYLAKRLTHPKGYTIALEVNQEYLIEFTNALYPVNLTYSGMIYNLYPNQYVIIKHKLLKKPDRVEFGGMQSSESIRGIDADSNKGNWHWDNATSTLTYIVSNKEGRQPFLDVSIRFNAYRCRYANCEPPISPASKLPITERPDNFLLWSEISSSILTDPEWTVQEVAARSLSGIRMSSMENKPSIRIPEGRYVIVDSSMPVMRYLQIEGFLELQNGMDHRVEADVIFINGGQLIVGWENDPMLNNVEIVLNGVRDALDYKLPNRIDSIGGKGIGVYGGLDIHGKPRQPSWTSLNATVAKGNNRITLKEPVDWQIGEQIVITTTSYVVGESEVATIAAKSSDNKTLTLSNSLQYEHLAFSQSFSDSESYSIAAGVGLLSRNVKVIGAEYTNQETDLYGFRVIVSDYSTMGADGPVYYKGYARLSDVEFVGAGQFSRFGGEEYRYGVLFSNLGEYNHSRPSYVTNCAFNYGYSAAVGILGSASIPITHNVIYRTIDFAIYLTGHSNIIRNNLIVSNLWAASLRPWSIFSEKEFYASVHIRDADSAVVENNLIAGSERIGFYFKGDVCVGQTFESGKNLSIKNNKIYSALSAVNIFPAFIFQSLDCVRISGFTVFKSAHWGIYYQARQTVQVDSNILVDNQINLFTQVIEPSILGHQLSSKKIFVKNNLIVGQSPTFDCNAPSPVTQFYYLNAGSMKSYSAGANSRSKVGITWAQFLSGSNGAPFKPWAGIMTYNALDGLMIVDNVTFANFATQCNGQRDYAISSNEKNDDGQHPMKLSNIKLYNVDHLSKIWINRPNIEKINPSDCVDMDCDGLKKNLLTDEDGTFLGQLGTVISQSEFEWGSQRRGLGDFRIPKEALAASNGSMLPISEVYSHLGIVREEDTCNYVSDWQAYECHGLDHKILTIESMDHDTESRRLSPVAIISDNKYLDLINGPQDHGWCFGYTCQKRVSSFMAVVAGQRSFDIYLSSTPPKQLRFRILNADQSFKIRISVYYFSSNRVDVYKNGRFELPSNGAYDSNGIFRINDYNTNLDSYMPKISNQSGTNLAVREHRKVYATMAGEDYLDFKMTAVLFLKFGVPAITESDFFRPENLVQNFADLFGIDPSRIRRVNIIGESRRKRQTQAIKFIELIIYDNPSNDSSITPEDQQSEASLNQLYANITNWYTTGQLQQMASDRLNVTLSSLQAEKPLSDSANEIKKLHKIRIIQDADNCREQSPCLTQPILVVLDESNKTVTGLGSSTNPWKIRAKIVSSTNLNLEIILESEANLGDDGFVQFGMLGLSQIANSFRLEFELVAPEGLSDPNIDSVQQKAISCSQAVLDLKHMEDQLIVDTDELFNLTVLIVDKYTQVAVNNISWRNHEWRAAVRVFNLPKSQPTGSLTSSSNLVEINLETKSLKLIDLFLDSPGMYIVEVTIISTGNEYILNKKSNVILVKSPTQSIALSESEPPILYLKFDQNITQNTEMIEVYKAIIYNSLIAKHDLILTRAISVYDFNMANLAFSLSSDPTSLVTELNNGFVLVDGINLAEATLYDQSLDVKVLTVVDDSNLDGSIGGTSSNACKLEIKQMMVFIVALVINIFLLMEKF